MDSESPHARLTKAIAASISTVVPPQFRVTANDGAITIVSAAAGSLESSTLFRWLLELDEEEDETALPADIPTAALAVLNNVQDYIIEALVGESWPTYPDDLRILPLPQAVVSDGVLSMWFGTESRVALRVPSVDLTPLGLP